jgi:hypothetical protein
MTIFIIFYPLSFLSQRGALFDHPSVVRSSHACLMYRLIFMCTIINIYVCVCVCVRVRVCVCVCVFMLYVADTGS